MKIEDFGGLCLTNAHLAFRPKGFSRRFAPQNDNGYAFTLLHMCILPHLRITTNGNYHNTILQLRFEDIKQKNLPHYDSTPATAICGRGGVCYCSSSRSSFDCCDSRYCFILSELTTFFPVCSSKASFATRATEPPLSATRACSLIV